MSAPEQAVNQTTAETLLQDDAARGKSQSLSEPRHRPPGEIKGYEIQQCLGNGAYGSVWLASERNTGKQVAIKFYSHRRGLDWSLLNREVEKLAVLYTSRDVVGLLQVGWEADPPYYVMEFLQNGSLSRQLEQGALPAAEAVRIATAVTSALVHAHQNGILHCDVKPANVLLDGDFSPRLADFGQARLSHEQSPALGTLFYMAPEQADLNAVPDPRWDVYALGALLYHMLCGEPPFRTPENEQRLRAADSLEKKLQIYRQIVQDGPRPARHRTVRGVDTRLAEIIDRCLAPDPARRFRDAAAVAEALAARARYRSLRPMIALGIVLPGLLLLSLFPLAVLAVEAAVETAERSIASRALESDAVAAKILAYSLKDDLDQRMRTLAGIAEDPGLIQLLSGMADPPGSPGRLALQKWLAREKDRIDEIRRESHSDLDESWFLNDVKGFQRWRDPPSDVSFEGNYGWRDYFHGLGTDREDWKERTDIEPLREPHNSAPFRSSTTGHMKVALSYPVRDSEGKIVGVLSRTIQLGSMLGSYKRLIGEDQRDRSGARVIALLDIREEGGHVLDHPWMTPENLLKLVKDDDAFDRLTLFPAQYDTLVDLRQRVATDQPVDDQSSDYKYFDPIRKVDVDAERNFGMPWLAAFWPVGNTGFFAVVQEKRDEALRPVREIRDGLIKYGLGGLLLCVTLVVTSWYFVRRVARAEVTRKKHRRGPGSGGTGLTGSLTAQSS